MTNGMNVDDALLELARYRKKSISREQEINPDAKDAMHAIYEPSVPPPLQTGDT